MPRPLFDWLRTRGAGILLHPTSLPGDLGCGVLGAAAHRFLDFLESSHLQYWQVLPLGPTGYGDSPYQSFSAFAGNPYLIDLQPLVTLGLLEAAELAPLQALPRERVDFGGLWERRWPILRQAWRRYDERGRPPLLGYGDFSAFQQQHRDWLDGYAAFMAFKDQFEGRSWNTWPSSLRSYQQALKSPEFADLQGAMDAQRFYQYLFFGQWRALREAADERGIQFIGDLPIFVAYDSADVWCHPELFQLDAEGEPLAVAGVPPDYFSPKGQLWGNPLYNWEALRRDGYRWWLDRLACNFELCDVLRLDHFRGFQDYWAIPAEAPDARSGRWKPGPRLDFFRALRERFPEARLIAEDLGDIDAPVRALREEAGLPGMAILEFAFDGKATNLYLPHHLTANEVVYPGSHDNDTARGWYRQLPDSIQDQIRRYLRISGDDISWDLIRTGYASVCRLAVFQAQDLHALGSEARMNTPGEAAGNWQWRLSEEQFEALFIHAPYFRELGRLYGRGPQED